MWGSLKLRQVDMHNDVNIGVERLGTGTTAGKAALGRKPGLAT